MLRVRRSFWVLLSVLLSVWIEGASSFPVRHQRSRHGFSGEVSNLSGPKVTHFVLWFFLMSQRLKSHKKKKKKIVPLFFILLLLLLLLPFSNLKKYILLFYP